MMFVQHHDKVVVVADVSEVWGGEGKENYPFKMQTFIGLMAETNLNKSADVYPCLYINLLCRNDE